MKVEATRHELKASTVVVFEFTDDELRRWKETDRLRVPQPETPRDWSYFIYRLVTDLAEWENG